MKETILEHEIGSDNGCPLVSVTIDEDKDYLFVQQNDDLIQLSRWQCLALAKELLNNRDYLRVAKKDSFEKALAETNERHAGALKKLADK
jgi:hypothetical protein